MARPSDEFAVAWASLTGSRDEPGWRAISLVDIGPLSLRAGRRFPGNHEALLVRFPTAKLAAGEKLPDGQGFSVERVDPYGDGITWLGLARKINGSVELFAAMASDIASALEAASAAGGDEPSLLRLFLGRVRAWQEFMRKGAGPLSAEAEIGLVGELAILSGVIDQGVSIATAVESWVGPFDGLQDFELGTGAIEVKSTVSAVGFTVKIGSLQQLDDSIRQPLFVAAVRLRQAANGQRLPDAVEGMRAKATPYPEAARMLADRLVAAGYFDTHEQLYVRAFDGASARMIHVGPAFPRLTLANVPAGVSRAVYDVDLDKVPGPNTDLAEALKKLGAI